MTQAPEPPESLPAYLAEGLSKQSPPILYEIQEYSHRLARHKEEKSENELKSNRSISLANIEEDEIPDEVPTKASLTIKTINGNQYYYWQWREGKKIKSCYIKPVEED